MSTWDAQDGNRVKHFKKNEGEFVVEDDELEQVHKEEDMVSMSNEESDNSQNVDWWKRLAHARGCAGSEGVDVVTLRIHVRIMQ